MKNRYFLIFLFYSSVVFANEATLLVKNVKEFLDLFNVARLASESQDDFFKRLNNDKRFISVVYACSSSHLCFEDKKLKISKNKEKKYHLGLFTDTVHVVKKCGYWTGDQDGFYVGANTIIVGKGLARFIEKGNYQWYINLLEDDDNNPFQNTPIEPLLDYIKSKKSEKIELPIDCSASIVFTKEASGFIGRLKYK